MKAEEALASFIRGVVNDYKARRYLALIGNPKGRKKFLDKLCHDFDTAVLPSCKQSKDFKIIWDMTCYAFSCHEGFGAEYQLFRDAYENLATWDGWLVLTTDGRFGVYRPEGRWDAERLLIKE